MSWTTSLIRVREFEVDTLRKRLKTVAERRTALEMRIATLDAELEAEGSQARGDAQAGWYLIGFREGWKVRRAALDAERTTVAREEEGCRDALSEAFLELKKVEQVAENMALAARKVEARREGQALDELALRKRGSRAY